MLNVHGRCNTLDEYIVANEVQHTTPIVNVRISPQTKNPALRRANDLRGAVTGLHPAAAPAVPVSWSGIHCFTLHRSSKPRSSRTAYSVEPISDGVGATRIPHSFIFAIFDAAVPLPPEMMAPA